MTNEQKIARRIINSALAEGWSVSVNDGENWAVKKSRDRLTILTRLRRRTMIFFACLTERIR